MFLAAFVYLLAESHWILVIYVCLQSEFHFMCTTDCRVDTELEEINCFSCARGRLISCTIDLTADRLGFTDKCD